MKNSVKKAVVVKHPETGLIITPSVNKPEFGTIRIDQEASVFTNGFFAVQKRTAFVRGRITDLESLGLEDGSTLDGKIIRKESFEPFYENQEPKINPQTNEVVLTDGRPTYLEFEYTEDKNASDHWVAESNEVAETADILAEQSMEP